MGWTTQYLTQRQAFLLGLTDKNHAYNATIKERKEFYNISSEKENDSEMSFNNETKITTWEHGLYDFAPAPLVVALYINGNIFCWEPIVERNIHLGFFKLGNISEFKVVYTDGTISPTKIDTDLSFNSENYYIMYSNYKY